MDRELILKLAKDAGLFTHKEVQPEIEAFAKLVRDDYSNKHAQLWLKRIDEAVKAEREACAKLADDRLMDTSALMSMPPKSSAAWSIAAAIRARST
jgi:hypothetical protein